MSSFVHEFTGRLLLGVTEHSPIDAIKSSPDSPAASSPSQDPTLRVRIVDYIGAFTLAKQLESSSKKALKSGPEAKSNVTILPPAEYAERFARAMETYFTGVPGTYFLLLFRLRLRLESHVRDVPDNRSFSGHWTLSCR